MSPERVDVLVVGFGAAGASAALTAAERGAAVRVVEKAAAGGGNCRHSGGFLFDVGGPAAVDHLDALCFGKTDREVLSAYAAGLPAVADWLAGLGGRTVPVDPADFGGMLPSWPHFPGAGRVAYRQYASERERPGAALWQLLEDSVRGRGIPVELDCAVTELIIEDGGVRGAIVGDGAARRQIEATGGVILACGGIEYDEELRDAYLPLPLVPVGHPANTGDALRLAQQAGASLWHMSAFFGWLAFRHPDFPAAFTLDVHAPSYLYVDADGRRFADETGWEVHDKVRCWTAFLPRNENVPHLPGYIVFDETARVAGPLNGIVGTPNDHVWSADNSVELERGWIARGDSASQLAAAIGIDPEILGATLQDYAAAAAAGRDERFGRRAQTLVPLVPPLYAIEMWPGLATASGGPRRDHRARVLGPGRTPIPGLYAAGAAGSVWGHLTEHGGGLTDAIVFGRIAGKEAAAG
jgi:succinate dehydrogenase/fumarate reductase flavoprotein subunit